MKIIKRILSLTAAALCAAFVASPSALAAGYKTPFDAHSEAAFMINTDTETIIYEKNPDKRMAPASLAKIMTAILAMEQVDDLEGTIVKAPAYVYDEFVGLVVSTADIRQNEELPMLDLLYALILPSACEAGSIIADYIGQGSIPAFVDMMNAKAKELGADNTTFTNAHGLYDKNQFTTARDMAVITQYALSFPIFEKICNTTSYQMPVTPRHPNGDWFIKHTNKMLVKGHSAYYEGMKGIKTGTLDEVGRNLISTASRGGYNYLLVTLGAPIYDENGEIFSEIYSYTDARSLYNWAFSSFSVKSLFEENEMVSEIPVALSADQDYARLAAQRDISALLPADSDASVLQQDITLAENVKAPVQKGDVLGKMELRMSGDTIATVELVSLDNLSRSPWLYALDLTGRFFSQPLIQTALVVLGALLLLYIAAVCRYNVRKRRARERRRNGVRRS